MTTYFINTNARDTPSKISSFLLSVGYEGPEVYYGAPVYCIKIDSQSRTYGFLGAHVPPCKNLTTLEGFRGTFPPAPGPSYEWVKKQLEGRTKQLSALGYEDRGGEMLAPPLGKPPEYILNDLSPEQAIQAFKDGKSVIVAGKPMTSGTTIEELLDSRLTLKHKRFGRIVLADQVTEAPKKGTLVHRALTFSTKPSLVTYSEDMKVYLESGCLHYTEQGAIDHAEEMARLNRDGFVEMDVEWLVKLKNELSTISHAMDAKSPTAYERIDALIDEVSKKIGEF